MENSFTRGSIHVTAQDRGRSTSILFNERAGSLLSSQSVDHLFSSTYKTNCQNLFFQLIDLTETGIPQDCLQIFHA